ncbi:MAG: glycoside hydrolase family 88 protein [Polyangiaceae bacterium]|nr:glycoside hydrolase family 88 protein [Polyangiaceae bacterium]
MKHLRLSIGLALLLFACGESDTTGNNDDPTGGSTSAGGTSSGGVSATGTTGGAATTGGQHSTPMGGTSSGGSSATGGNATGGLGTGTATGGSSEASGGATATGGGGGTTGRGGAPTGGVSATGGASGGRSSGGRSSGGASAGGATASGGGSNVGGSSTSGGATAGGSGGASGGDSGTGGDTGACPTVSEFDTWNSGKGPTDVGKLAVQNFMPRTSETYGGDGYAWTFGYVGSLQFTKTTGDTTNNQQLISKFDCNQQGPDNGTSASVDTRAFGVLPLEIFLQNGSEACKTLGLARADAQWSRTTADGITSDARYWIDDMYMITALQVYAYRATQDTKYVERAGKAMLAYIAALQQSDGLFWHTKQSKAYWGRANGWVASGMTELLLDLPAGADRDNVMAAYKKQMDALLQHQITSGSDVGGWRQVIDRTDAKPEMSCSAMFTFALATGVKNGWLTDPKYATAAHDGWAAVANRTNGSGALDQVCPGTGQAPAGDLAAQQKFYMDIAFQANDRHGQGPELWAANALLRKDCPGKI